MNEFDVHVIAGIHEPVSCLTHLLAAPVFGVLGYLLLRRGRGNWGRTASLAALCVATVFMLSMSAAYHTFGPGPERHVMLRLDVAAIFMLIAGTLTPIHVILFRGFHRWAPLVLVWSAAAVGITLRTVMSRSFPGSMGTYIFLLIGWGGLVSCILLWRRYGFSFVNPLLCGGLAYTLGVGVVALDGPTLVPGVVGPHELWHVFVLVGLSLHWKFVFSFAAGSPASEQHPVQAQLAVEQYRG